MSEEQLKAFWEAVQADTSLQKKLRAATDADSIASIAKEAGFEITADEVKEAQSELSEEQLKEVAGGRWYVEYLRQRLGRRERDVMPGDVDKRSMGRDHLKNEMSVYWGQNKYF